MSKAVWQMPISRCHSHGLLSSVHLKATCRDHFLSKISSSKQVMIFGLAWGWTWSDLFPGWQPCLADFLSFFPVSPTVLVTFISFPHVTKSTCWPFKRELAGGSTSVFQLLCKVRHLFEGGLFPGWKGDSSAAQPLFGSLFLSSASVFVHVILVRWTSHFRVHPLVNLCLPGHFAGNISS